MRLRAVDYIDEAIEGHYASYSFEQHSTRSHQHDFYEIFLIADGYINHHINQETQLLSAGTLVFIRPDDRHSYTLYGDERYRLINLAFLNTTFLALTDYLGLDAHQEVLLKPHLPPMVHLTAKETNDLSTELSDWGRLLYRDKERSRLALRALLASILSDYFVARGEDYAEDVPQWLMELCQTMTQPEYIIEGRPALMRLANRSPEYVGRAFKAYLDTTPSQFITDLRLDYASDLLLYQDDSVTDICFAVGFGNLSHFYHRFKARWNCSPLTFRKSNRRTLIP